jgi:hypothetical protein
MLMSLGVPRHPSQLAHVHISVVAGASYNVCYNSCVDSRHCNAQICAYKSMDSSDHKLNNELPGLAPALPHGRKGTNVRKRCTAAIQVYADRQSTHDTRLQRGAR